MFEQLDEPVIGIFADEWLNLGEQLLEQFELLILASDRLQIVKAFRLKFALQVPNVAIQRPHLFITTKTIVSNTNTISN